ncbi:DUF4112 domain-containing protein [Haloarcula amylolytica]|uniref:DUF4112 domain-containing protein n=1 Tax=Haloarcula amylolytica TaxID=396317 RepID=UPI003C785457
MDTEPAALGRIRAVAHLLDESIRVPGTSFRVGIDPIVGLLPIAGDLATAVCSLYIVAEAVRLGIPKRTVVRLLANIAVDAALGSVPMVGDLFDAYWKANVKNAELIATAVSDR